MVEWLEKRCAGCARALSPSSAAANFSNRVFHAECLRVLHPELSRPLVRPRSNSGDDEVSVIDSTPTPTPRPSHSKLRRTGPPPCPAAFAYPISVPLAALSPRALSCKAAFYRGRSGEPAEQLSARALLHSADAAPARALLSLSLEGLLQRCVAMGLVRDRPQRLGFSVVRGALDARELVDFCVATGQCASRAEAARVGVAMVGAGLLVPSVPPLPQPSGVNTREGADPTSFLDREGLLFLVILRRRSSVREAVIAPATRSEASAKKMPRKGVDKASAQMVVSDPATSLGHSEERGATQEELHESEGQARDVRGAGALTESASVRRTLSSSSIPQAVRLSPVGRLEATLARSNFSSSASEDRDTVGVDRDNVIISGLHALDSRRSPAGRGRSVSEAFRRLPSGSDDGPALLSDTPLSCRSSDVSQLLHPKRSLDVEGADVEETGGGRLARSMSDASWEVRLRQNTATFTEQPLLGPTSTLALASAARVAEPEHSRKREPKQVPRGSSEFFSVYDDASKPLDRGRDQDNQDAKISGSKVKSPHTLDQEDEVRNDITTRDARIPFAGIPETSAEIPGNAVLPLPSQTPPSVVTFAVSRFAGAITSRIGRLAAFASPFPSYKREASRGVLAPGIVGSGSKKNAAVAPGGEGLGSADHAATIRELISSLSPISSPSTQPPYAVPAGGALVLGAPPEADPLASDSDLEDANVPTEDGGYSSADGIRSTSPVVAAAAAAPAFSSIAQPQSDLAVGNRGRSQRAADLAAGRKTSSALAAAGSVDEQQYPLRPSLALGSALPPGVPKMQLLRERRRHLAAVRAELLSRTWAQGWLVKQGHVRKTWRRRWFLLRGCNLTYFRSAQALGADRALPGGSASATIADSESSSTAPTRGGLGSGSGSGAFSEEPAGIIDVRQFSLEKAALSRSALCFRLAHKHSSFDYLVHADEGDEAGFVAWVRALALAMRSFDDLGAEIGLFLSAQAAAALHQQAVGRLGSGTGGAEAVRTW